MKFGRPDVVFDCNIFLQALSRPAGPAAHALNLVERNEITLHVSRAVLKELRQILAYPEIREKNPQVVFRARLARNVRRRFNYARDPGDEPYLDLAAGVRADFLVTRDKDLLSLVTDHSLACLLGLWARLSTLSQCVEKVSRF